MGMTDLIQNWDSGTAGDPGTGARAATEIKVRQVRDHVLGAIRSGRLPPGTRLPTERDLAGRFGAARNAVRRALGELETAGLLTRQVGRGTFVADAPADGPAAPAPPSLAELIEARLLFEPHMAALAAARATPEHFVAMDHCLEALRTAADWVAFKEAKYALHVEIARATGNRFLIQTMAAVVTARRAAHWDRPQAPMPPVDVVRKTGYAENRAVVDALKRGDAAAAGQGITTSLQRVLASISEA